MIQTPFQLRELGFWRSNLIQKTSVRMVWVTGGSLVCLLKYGFTWTPRAGRAGLWGESLQNDTLRQKWECQHCSGATSTAEQGPPCRNCCFHQHILAVTNIINFIGSVLLELSAQCCCFMSYRRKLNPPRQLFAFQISFFRRSFLQCAGTNIDIFVPLKEWKWLNKP